MRDWSDYFVDPSCAQSPNPNAQCNCKDSFNVVTRAQGTGENILCSALQMLSRDGVPVETAEAINAAMKVDSETAMHGHVHALLNV